jgi:hypothetical protein
MLALRRPNCEHGFLLAAVLSLLGLVSILLAAYCGIVSHELASVVRATARTQALYAAEAGLDAANDLLNQEWECAYRQPPFPLQESLVVSVDGQAVAAGAFMVTVNPLDEDTLRLTSTGRSAHQVARALSMVVVRKRKPSFRQGGLPVILELEAGYFDKDGAPDLLVTSGTLLASEEEGRTLGLLSAGSQDALEIGYHLAASLTDIDRDGDLDLLLSDAPSRGEEPPAAFIPTIPLSAALGASWLHSTAAADVLGTGKAIPFLSQGWLWLPDGTLSELGEGTDVFFNQPIYDGTLIVSWGEIPTPSP